MIRRFGVRWTPYVRSHPWLPPVPVLASWQALRSIGIHEVRLTYTQDTPELEAAFAIDYANILAAGLTVNINAGPPWVERGGDVPQALWRCIKPDPAAIEAWAFEMATKYPVRLYTFDNEPGALAQAYEAQNGGDFMVEAYMPACVVFVNGIRSVIPDALFGGCDADSVEIQARFVELWLKLLPDVPFRRRVHPYGDGFADQRYSTMAGDGENEGYATLANNLPLDIGEIGVGSYNYMQIPTDAEIAHLLSYLRFIDAKYPFVGQIDMGGPDDWFTRYPVVLSSPPDPRDSWSTFRTDKPVASDAGRALAAHIARVNKTKSGRPPGRRG